MFPYLGPFAIYDVLILFCVLIALFTLGFLFGRSVGALCLFILSLGTTVAGIVGGRLFHVLWERPAYFHAHPGEIFSRWDGSTFYGVLFGAALTFHFLTRKLIKNPSVRDQIWDVSSILAALFVGILRIACFASGCCWGKISSVPWAVRFTNPQSAMPMLGIPVHPVQLYDSFWGFIVAAILITLRRKVPRLQGRLIYVFCAAYAAGRFTTEFFRGDGYRGTHLLLGLSTSQLISLVLAPLALILLYKRRPRQVAKAAAVMSLGLLSSCLPHAPGWETILHSQVLPDGVVSQEMNTYESAAVPSSERGHRTGGVTAVLRIHGRNAIFAASDAMSEEYYADDLAQFYGPKAPRLAEFAWWLLAPRLARLYDRVFQIPWNDFNTQTLFDAIAAAEAAGKPYDLYIQTNGLSHHLVASPHQGLIRYESLVQLAGKAPHLELVYLDACLGLDLADVFFQAGAREMISFPSLEKNFFFIDFFLRHYARHPTDIERSFDETRQSVFKEILKDRLYRAYFRRLNESLKDFVAENPPPELRRAP